MNWKEKTLSFIREQAEVKPISCHENTFVVEMTRGNDTLRTIIRLDVENETIAYENTALHTHTCGEDLVESMSDHLFPVEGEVG